MLNEIQLNNYSNYFDCLVNDLDKTSRYAEPMGQETVFSFVASLIGKIVLHSFCSAIGLF